MVVESCLLALKAIRQARDDSHSSIIHHTSLAAPFLPKIACNFFAAYKIVYLIPFVRISFRWLRPGSESWGARAGLA